MIEFKYKNTEKDFVKYSMLIDVSKCYGCMACVTACAAENNVPVGVFRTWIERYVRSKGAMIFVPKQCFHCDNPTCVEVCPVNATFKTEDGIVLIDDDICIGCGSCVVNCPYGARFVNPVKGVADKCTYCEHRLKLNLLPACVEACPTGARIFGNLNDPSSEIRNIAEMKNTSVFNPWTGNKPQLLYLNLPEEAR